MYDFVTRFRYNDSARNVMMVKRKIDTNTGSTRKNYRVSRYWSLCHDSHRDSLGVLLVVVPSRDFYVRNGHQLASDISPRRRPSKFAWTRAVGDVVHNSINLSICFNETTCIRVPVCHLCNSNYLLTR